MKTTYLKKKYDFLPGETMNVVKITDKKTTSVHANDISEVSIKKDWFIKRGYQEIEAEEYENFYKKTEENLTLKK